MTEFFTSDLHLGHANILKYCGRTIFMIKRDLEIYYRLKNASEEEQKKFKINDESLKRMNEGLIKRWNERVKPEDLVYHIGDFCFKNSKNRGEGINTKSKTWEEQLNGKIIFLKGNHDKGNSTKTRIHRLVINIDKHHINLVHDPIYADINYELNLTGHIHEKWLCKRIRKGYSYTDCFNVGVDQHNFYPITYNEIKDKYHKWLKENGYK